MESDRPAGWALGLRDAESRDIMLDFKRSFPLRSVLPALEQCQHPQVGLHLSFGSDACTGAAQRPHITTETRLQFPLASALYHPGYVLRRFFPLEGREDTLYLGRRMLEQMMLRLRHPVAQGADAPELEKGECTAGRAQRFAKARGGASSCGNRIRWRGKANTMPGKRPVQSACTRRARKF